MIYLDNSILFRIFAAGLTHNSKSMSKDNKHKDGRRFRMPYTAIAFWAFLGMPVSFFVLDSPTLFWLSFLACSLSIGFATGRWIQETKDDYIPWWYGGL